MEQKRAKVEQMPRPSLYNPLQNSHKICPLAPFLSPILSNPSTQTAQIDTIRPLIYSFHRWQAIARHTKKTYRGYQMENSNKRQRFIKIDEVIAVTTLSETQIYRKMKAGEFPPNIAIGANSKVWLESEVQDWIAEKIENHRKETQQ